MEQCHVDFGEAVYLTGTVAALIESELLDFVNYVVLAVQIGAHLSVALEKDNNVLSDDAEKKFLVGPLQRFLHERDKQSDDVVDLVQAELTRCQIIAAFSMYKVTSDHAGQFAQAWDTLVARERVDYQNRSAILHQEATILDNLTEEVDRLLRFKDRLRPLKFDESARDMYRAIESDLDNWRTQINRLRATL
jgi:hypothetical protein